MQLNPAQMEAVNYTSGPCLVLAGAGSGKTRVIITKIVHLINHKIATPDQILAVTFTNKAALEMRERIAKEVPSEVAAEITISTFHSLGRLILKENAKLLKLGRNFSIFDENDTQKVIKQILDSDYQNLKDSGSYEYIQSICHRISMWKGELKTAKALQSEPGHDAIMVDIYQKYIDYLRSCNAVDFDDLIFLPTRLLLLSEQVRKTYQERFKYILVDEYQDTNQTQYYLLMCLVATNQRFTVVGDDDQSIYSWRGARPENIKQLTLDFPNLKVIKLEENYRSTSRILRCANHIIANNPHIFEKTLYSSISDGEKIMVKYAGTSEESCEWVAAQILGHQFDHKTKWSDYAILYRSNSQSRDMEKAMLSAHIPCKVTGDTSFFSRMEVKDILAWCRLLTNPHDDVALLRVINVPQRGIGAKTLKTLTDLSHEFNCTLFQCACSQELAAMLNKSQYEAITGFLALIQRFRLLLSQRKDVEVCKELVTAIGYDNYLKVENKETAYEWKLKNVNTLLGWIEELVNGEKGEVLSFGDAVERLGLREMMDKQDKDDDDNVVQLMTLHASKGLEFPYVFLIGMEEGILPHRTSIDENNIEEERRLAYVGVTRAKKELTLVVAHERKRAGAMVVQEESRFIKEMPQSDLMYIDAPDKDPTKTKERIGQNISRAISEILS